MLEIRKASTTEYNAVRNFYHTLIDMMEDAEFHPGWEKEVYPADSYLTEALANGELFVGTSNKQIVASMILNHESNESYEKISWPTQAPSKEVLIIHALGVLPTHTGNGFAKQMTLYALEYAKKTAQKVVRLDVLSGNTPAKQLYPGLGFSYVDTIQMYYEDTGWTDFLLYEYPIKDDR